MHIRYTWIRRGETKKKKKRKNKNKNKTSFSTHWAGDHSRVSAAEYDTLPFYSVKQCQTLRGTPGFYSTSGAVDYTAVIFCAHLVVVKCEVFNTTSTREIQLCARPAAQLTCSPLLPADFTRQSTAHARKSNWKGSNRHEVYEIALSEVFATQMGVTEAQHQSQLFWIVQIWPIFASQQELVHSYALGCLRVVTVCCNTVDRHG